MPGSAGCEPDLGGGHTFPAVSLPLLVSGIAFKELCLRKNNNFMSFYFKMHLLRLKNIKNL